VSRRALKELQEFQTHLLEFPLLGGGGRGAGEPNHRENRGAVSRACFGTRFAISGADMTTVGYHGAINEFRRRLIEATLHQCGGNRTRTARALGLQRTYLLRLMRELAVAAPPAPRGGRRRRGGALLP